MLRIILCVFIPLFFNYNNLSSQILKLSGGINRTWMNEKPFDTPCLTYTGSLGYDYLLDRDYLLPEHDRGLSTGRGYSPGTDDQSDLVYPANHWLFWFL